MLALGKIDAGHRHKHQRGKGEDGGLPAGTHGADQAARCAERQGRSAADQQDQEMVGAEMDERREAVDGHRHPEPEGWIRLDDVAVEMRAMVELPADP